MKNMTMMMSFSTPDLLEVVREPFRKWAGLRVSGLVGLVDSSCLLASAE